MPEHDTLTAWLHRLQAGDRSAAVERLWTHYFERMVRLARQRLGQQARAADGEDVALSAFDSFVRAAAAGRFPRLHDRDDLWRVLFALTARKAADVLQAEGRLKRGGGATAGAPPDTLPAAEPDPAEAAAVAEACDRLLARLPSDELRRVAVWKLEGYSNAEIAAQLGRSEVTAERKLRLVRECWAADGRA